MDILTLSIFFTDHGYDSSEIYANDQLVSAAKYQQNSPPTMPGSHNSRYIGTAKVRFFLKKRIREETYVLQAELFQEETIFIIIFTYLK